MNIKLQRIIGQLIPFILIGIIIAFSIGLLVIFSYVLMWGLLIGAVIWVTITVKNYFFPRQSPVKTPGRVIEHEDDIK